MSVQGVQQASKSPCPCCGRLVFEGGPGTDDICPVCFWQDDLLCLLDPFEAVGPNKVSLTQAQKNFDSFGLCDPRYGDAKNRRAAPRQFVLDEGWRPIDPAKDRFSSDDYPADKATAYYWRADYWLKPAQG